MSNFILFLVPFTLALLLGICNQHRVKIRRKLRKFLQKNGHQIPRRKIREVYYVSFIALFCVGYAISVLLLNLEMTRDDAILISALWYVFGILTPTIWHDTKEYFRHRKRKRPRW